MEKTDKKLANKRDRIALILFFVGVIWWFAENIYFGWNSKPVNMWEGIADFMVWVFWGSAFFIKPSRIEITNIEKTTMVNTPMVEIIRPNDVIMKQQSH